MIAVTEPELARGGKGGCGTPGGGSAWTGGQYLATARKVYETWSPEWGSKEVVLCCW